MFKLETGVLAGLSKGKFSVMIKMHECTDVSECKSGNKIKTGKCLLNEVILKSKDDLGDYEKIVDGIVIQRIIKICQIFWIL